MQVLTDFKSIRERMPRYYILLLRTLFLGAGVLFLFFHFYYRKFIGNFQDIFWLRIGIGVYSLICFGLSFKLSRYVSYLGMLGLIILGTFFQILMCITNGFGIYSIIGLIIFVILGSLLIIDWKFLLIYLGITYASAIISAHFTGSLVNQEQLLLIITVAGFFTQGIIIIARQASTKYIWNQYRHHRDMFEGHNAVMLIIDPGTGMIVDANPAACRFYGYNLDRLKKMRIFDINTLTPEQTQQKMTEARGRNLNHFEFDHMLSDGSVRTVEVHSTPIHDDNRMLLYSIIHDITNRKLAEKNLIEMNQSLNAFAYTASHDLKEPLRTINISSRFLKKKCDHDDQEKSQLLNDIEQSTERLTNLIDHLLIYARADNTDLKKERVDLNIIVQQAVNDLNDLISQSKASISVESLPIVQGNRIIIYELFENIIGNAIKYAKPELTPLVNIDTNREPEWINVSIADNGIGIPDRHLGRVFEPFYRIHKDSHIKGNGIGLATCKKIMDKHHGEILIESEEGKGTTVILRFPKPDH